MMMGQGGHIDYSQQYLTFTAVGGQSRFYYEDGEGTNALSYSLDGGSTWTALAKNTNTPYIQDGASIMWKADGISVGRNYGIRFYAPNSSGWVVSGNIMSVLHGDNFIGQTTLTVNYQFEKLFYECTSLRDASNLILPATTLTSGCYYQMFYGCTSLVNAPVLPATTLSVDCYSDMFHGCTSLVNAPVLPAPTLTQRCYMQMFYGCSSLRYIKCLATDISASVPTTYWVSGVASTGTFVMPSFVPWTRGTSGIPTGWTVVVEGASLPDGYTLLAGMTLNGNQYFDTGIYLQGSDSISLAYKATKACNVMGCYTTTDATNNYSLYLSTTSGAKYMRYGSGTYNSYFVTNKRYDVEISPLGTSGLEVDSTWSPLTFTSSTTCLIGTTSTGATSSKFTGDFYGAIVIAGKANYLPALRESDNHVGWYDTVNDEFLENQGTGNATAITL